MFLQGGLEIMGLVNLRVPFIGGNDVDLDRYADLGQFALDELGGNRVRVIIWRVDGEGEAVWITGLLQKLLGAFGIIGVYLCKIDIPRIGRRHERADQRAIIAPYGLQQLLIIDGASKCLAYFHIVEWRNAVIIG